jgi:hypothetical protein
MTDQLDISQLTIVDSPDPKAFAHTVDISRVVMSPDGFAFDANIPPSWMTHVPGWGDLDKGGTDPGNLLFTVWLGVPLNGQWYAAGFIQKFDFTPTGAPILAIAPDKGINNFQANWAYDGRWAPMNSYTPHVGDTIALMLTAGNARGAAAGGVKAERSQIVLIQIPDGGVGEFRVQSVQPPAPPAPPVDPAPVVPPVPPSDGLAAVLARLDRIEAAIGALKFPDYETHLPVHAYVSSLDIVLKPKVG